MDWDDLNARAGELDDLLRRASTSMRVELIKAYLDAAKTAGKIDGISEISSGLTKGLIANAQ